MVFFSWLFVTPAALRRSGHHVRRPATLRPPVVSISRHSGFATSFRASYVVPPGCLGQDVVVVRAAYVTVFRAAYVLRSCLRGQTYVVPPVWLRSHTTDYVRCAAALRTLRHASGVRLRYGSSLRSGFATSCFRLRYWLCVGSRRS